MRRLTSLPSLLLLLLVLAPSGNLLADEDDDQRAEARKTIFIEWSKDAKTASLGLDASATKFVDLYLDYARSSYARRQKRSSQFMGVPHLEWLKTEGGLAARAAFVNLELDRAEIPAGAAAIVLEAIGKDGFVEAVKVEGDDEDLLRQWGVLLATAIVDTLEGDGKVPGHEAYAAAKQALFTRLLDTVDDTPSLEGRWSRPGTIEDTRHAWLQGILVLGGDAAGARLAELRKRFQEDGSARDVEAATTSLAAAPGDEALAFVETELASGDAARQLLVFRTFGPHASPALIAVLAELFTSVPDDRVAQGALGSLMRAARKGSPATRKAGGAKLRALLTTLEAGSKRHTDVLFAVVASQLADREVVKLLEASFEKAKAEGANDFVKRRYEGALKAAREQAAAE